ncbi:MAG: tetratricopeptide repeat protein [Verrucomicrobia bacterium]|nr:tetratricopeptide repeat protein [Verrucomicrobiota bacterium]
MLINISRRLLGLGSGAWGVWSLHATLSSPGPFDGNTAFAIAYASLALVGAAVLLAADFARFISMPLLAFIENLYMPSGSTEKPPLSFRLGRFYAANGRFQDAEKDYRRMLRFYPEEPEGWIELMTLYWMWSPKARKHDALQTCERGIRKVDDSAKRLQIEKAMMSLKNGELPVNFVTLSERDKAQKHQGS